MKLHSDFDVRLYDRKLHASYVAWTKHCDLHETLDLSIYKEQDVVFIPECFLFVTEDGSQIDDWKLSAKDTDFLFQLCYRTKKKLDRLEREQKRKQHG